MRLFIWLTLLLMLNVQVRASLAGVPTAQADDEQKTDVTVYPRLVLTLGDVLFSSGTATLNGGGDGHLDKLAGFLNRYPARTAIIDGYTDSIGSDDYNQGLSERRAEAVKNYLIGQGIDAQRLTASGMGKSSPVASNGSAAGRQQNRRVEVTISNPPVAVATVTAPALGDR